MKFFTYLEKCRELEALEQEVEALENDPEVVATQRFLSRLHELMEASSVTPEDVRDILYPPRVPATSKTNQAKQSEPGEPAPRTPRIHAPREPAVYQNPHTGEVLKTRDPRNSTLKAWRDKYGMSEVVNWKVN